MLRSASSSAPRYLCLRHASRPVGRFARRYHDTAPGGPHDAAHSVAAPPRPRPRPINPANPFSIGPAMKKWRADHKRQMRLLGLGFAASSAALLTIALVDLGQFRPRRPDRAESPPGAPPFDRTAPAAATAAQLEHEGLVRTGSDAVPLFPRTIRLPSARPSASAALPVGTGAVDDEYQLLGLGVRTVSFLAIKVYVVGLYVASADLAALQARLVREGAAVEGASALIASEKDALRRRLADPAEGPALWDALLREGGVRSALRIVPTRATDFGHLKDGWLRAIASQSRSAAGGGERFDDEAFGAAVDDFKQIMGKGSLGKGKVLVLGRGSDGLLSLWVQQKEAEGSLEKAGEVADERVSRLIWLNYLAGKQVASEPARASIIDGVMDMVSRPVGSVETKVI